MPVARGRSRSPPRGANPSPCGSSATSTAPARPSWRAASTPAAAGGSRPRTAPRRSPVMPPQPLRRGAATSCRADACDDGRCAGKPERAQPHPMRRRQSDRFQARHMDQGPTSHDTHSPRHAVRFAACPRVREQTPGVDLHGQPTGRVRQSSLAGHLPDHLRPVHATLSPAWPYQRAVSFTPSACSAEPDPATALSFSCRLASIDTSNDPPCRAPRVTRQPRR